MFSRRVQWVLAYQAAVYGAALLLLTGLVWEWGAWYSNSTPYRLQTDALLERMALPVIQEKTFDPELVGSEFKLWGTKGQQVTNFGPSA
jgi:hypothetical protein